MSSLRRPAVRFALLLAGLAALACILALVGVPDRAALVAAIRGTGSAAPVVAVLGVTGLTLAMMPRTALAFVGGLLFGTLAGAAYVLVGSLLGAALAFAAGRLLGRDFVAHHTGRPGRIRERLARLDGWLGRRGAVGVFTIRLIPLAPFGVMSYAFGASATRWRDFLLGSAAGSMPSCLVYAAMGAAVVSASPVALAAGGAGLAVLMVLSTLGARWARGRLSDTPPAACSSGSAPASS